MARAWQRMLSGRRLDLLDPSPLDIEIEDIAHGLSREARWNGQTAGDWGFTVAQHCVLVERLLVAARPKASRQMRLATLLHDAAEYVIGDLITPFKAAVGLDYKQFERRLSGAIHLRFGLPAHLPDEWEAAIKRADKLAAYYEATLLAGFDPAEAAKFFGQPRKLFVENLVAEPPAVAKAGYLARFAALSLR